MNINDVIDWIMRRDDIVVADKDKFVADMRERFHEQCFNGFLDEVRFIGKELVKKHTAPGKQNHILVIATDEKNVTTHWGGSIDGLTNAYLNAAVEDDDYVTLASEISKNLLMIQMKRLFGHDDD